MNFKLTKLFLLLALNSLIANTSASHTQTHDSNVVSDLHIVKNWSRNQSAFYAAQTTDSLYIALDEQVTKNHAADYVDNFDYEAILDTLRERDELDGIPDLIEFVSTWQRVAPLKAFLNSGIDLNSHSIEKLLLDQVNKIPKYRSTGTLRVLVEAGICVDAALELEVELDYGTEFLQILLMGRASVKGLVSAYNRANSNEKQLLILKKIARSDPEISSKVLRNAVQGNRLELVKDLFKNNVQTLADDSNGHTLLHLACINPNFYDMIELLISEGLNVNAQTNQLMTPLMILAASTAHKSNPSGTRLIVDLLISHGAELEIIGPGGLLAHEMAELNENFVLAAYLEEQIRVKNKIIDEFI